MSAVGQRHAGAPPRLDPCCPHRAGGRVGRCQLWAGHQGPHAVMFGRDGQRLVRLWTDDAHPRWHELGHGYEMLPWMIGYPTPAWQEP